MQITREVRLNYDCSMQSSTKYEEQPVEGERHGNGGMVEAKMPGGKFVRLALDGNGQIHMDGDFFIEDRGNEPVRNIERLLSALVPRGVEDTATAAGSVKTVSMGSRPRESGSIETGSMKTGSKEAMEDMTPAAMFGAAASAIDADMRAISGVTTGLVAQSFVRLVYQYFGRPLESAEERAQLDRAYRSWVDETEFDDTVSESEALDFWRNLAPQLRIVRDVPRSPQEQMQIESAWSGEVASGKRPPTLRVWDWASRAVVLGKFQREQREVNESAARKLGFDIVRRETGGGAMIVVPEDTITVSLYMPLDLTDGKSVAQMFQLCDYWLVEALRNAGIPARFAGLNDIAGPNGKFGGSAQRIYKKSGARGCLLHHTTLAYDMRPELLATVLNTSPVKLSDKGVASAKKRVDPLRNYTDLSRTELVDVSVDWVAGM